MRKGFTKIPNSLLDQPWAKNPTVVYLYTWLAINADADGKVALSLSSLVEHTGLSKKQVRDSIEKLVRAQFVAQLRAQKGAYSSSVLTVCCTGDYEDEKLEEGTIKGTIKGTKKERGFFPLDKETPPIPSKEIKPLFSPKEIIPPLSPQGGNASYDWSLLSEPMKPIVQQWLSYKKEKKQTYKPTGFRTFCKRLVQLSGNDPLKAQQIVEYSMACNYSGIFELNYHATTQTNQQPYHDSDHPTTEQLRQQTAAYIASRLAQD